jgi:tetratricopeptide (TPR) repeat protein
MKYLFVTFVFFLSACSTVAPPKKIASPAPEPIAKTVVVEPVDTGITLEDQKPKAQTQALPDLPVPPVADPKASEPLSAASQDTAMAYPPAIESSLPTINEPIAVVPPQPPEPQPQFQGNIFSPPPPQAFFSMAANPAVTALEAEITKSMKAGSYQDAAATLERAIRIQPKNPELWSVLARAKLRLRQYDQAEQFAKKSNLYVKNNPELLKSNWYLIAEARRFKGDYNGSFEAQEKARAE